MGARLAVVRQRCSIDRIAGGAESTRGGGNRGQCVVRCERSCTKGQEEGRGSDVHCGVPPDANIESSSLSSSWANSGEVEPDVVVILDRSDISFSPASVVSPQAALSSSLKNPLMLPTWTSEFVRQRMRDVFMGSNPLMVLKSSAPLYESRSIDLSRLVNCRPAGAPSGRDGSIPHEHGGS